MNNLHFIEKMAIVVWLLTTLLLMAIPTQYFYTMNVIILALNFGVTCYATATGIMKLCK